jgi:hypothetical protein
MFALSVSLNMLAASIVLTGWVAPNVKATFNPDNEAPPQLAAGELH